LLTLYITPVFYIYMESFQNWLSSFRKRSVSSDVVGATYEREAVLAGKSGK
jgi:hypothetical protein